MIINLIQRDKFDIDFLTMMKFYDNKNLVQLFSFFYYQKKKRFQNKQS